MESIIYVPARVIKLETCVKGSYAVSVADLIHLNT